MFVYRDRERYRRYLRIKEENITLFLPSQPHLFFYFFFLLFSLWDDRNQFRDNRVNLCSSFLLF